MNERFGNMAKLRTLLCLAIWLMVAFIASVTANRPQDHFDGSTALEKMKEIEAIDRNERSQDQWEELTKGYVEMLSNTDEANKMSMDEVVRAFDNLIEASKGALTYARKWLPESWRDLWHLRANLGTMKQGDCSNKKIDLISQLIKEKKKCQWQSNYVLGCFRDYLDRCGYERNYKEVIKSMNDPDLIMAKYPTLDSYFRSEVWTDSWQSHRVRSFEIGLTIEVLKDIVALEQDGAKTNCKFEVYSSHMRMLKDVRFSHSRLFGLAKYRALLYSRKCGFEDYYKKEINRIEAFAYRLSR